MHGGNFARCQGFGEVLPPHPMRDAPAPNLAIFCDYENVAIGVKEARYPSFDIAMVLERLLDKGRILVKKAYSDWSRYKSSKGPLHEAGFELIEVPHLRISGKNSADIKMVVDAVDLCYTKAHIDAFVIVSGDSDFSPLVSKLRENNRTVIGVGVKNSTSNLLVEQCDEFIYYDDLVRDRRAQSEQQSKRRKKSQGRRAQAARTEVAPAASTTEATAPTEPTEPTEPQPENPLKEEALEMVLETVDALFRDRDDAVWASQIKQTIKRKRPNFNETYHGYRNFSELVRDAADRNLLEIQKDEKSGGYLILAFGREA